MKASVPVHGRRGEMHFAQVDEDIAPTLLPWRWDLGTDGYARRKRRLEDGNDAPVRIAMHREVLGLHLTRAKPGDDVDHIDGDRLNNRRANLRRATRSQNNLNRPIPPDRYRGVRYFRSFKVPRPWVAYVTKDGKQHHVGYFSSPFEAAIARDIKARELFGGDAVLNFPESFPSCR